MNGIVRLHARHEPLDAPFPAPEILGDSPAMQDVFRYIARLSRSSASVLINGETGTGKELLARALHAQSPRKSGPFVALNMAAIPRDLLESELFGHERGAFTGAHARRTGRFEQADGGTLFLDEIGDMPADLQTRLLRVLGSGEYYPVGARDPLRKDVRIITATHQDLPALVAEGRFREDLFHRLNVIRLTLPPLRERRQDIPLLLQHYLARCAGTLGEAPKMLAQDTVDYLCTLEWPGNVRQLENLCHWLTVMASGRIIYPDDLPPELRATPSDAPPTAEVQRSAPDWQQALRDWVTARLATDSDGIARDAVAMAEGVIIEAALLATRGNHHLAAKRLGYGRNTLTRKIKALDLFAKPPLSPSSPHRS